MQVDFGFSVSQGWGSRTKTHARNDVRPQSGPAIRSQHVRCKSPRVQNGTTVLKELLPLGMCEPSVNTRINPIGLGRHRSVVAFTACCGHDKAFDLVPFVTNIEARRVFFARHQTRERRQVLQLLESILVTFVMPESLQTKSHRLETAAHLPPKHRRCLGSS